jgi:chaperonin cofactor prefoldin
MDNEKIVEKVAEHDVRIGVLERNHAQLETDVKKLSDMNVSIHDMLGEMKAMRIETNGKIDTLDTKFENLTTDVKQVKTGLSEVSNKVTELEAVPDKKDAKLFNDIKYKILWIIIAGAVGFLLAQAFPQIF